MEIQLSFKENMRVEVTINGWPSHSFNFNDLITDDHLPYGSPEQLEGLINYGRTIYDSLFPKDSQTARALAEEPERILLISLDEALDAIPWEYVYAPDGFLVLDYPFVRGLPVEKRINSPQMDGELHIIGVPSNPLDENIIPLNIEAEWLRLKEIVQSLDYNVTLERTRPPTVNMLRNLVAKQSNCIIHFMGHGKKGDKGASLLFESECGASQSIIAKDFVQATEGSTYLVTLNACISAEPGETEFDNLAATLVKHRIPYALGMRYSIFDNDAITFSRTLYSELVCGTSVEKAVFQARRALCRDNPRIWVVGIPVLYTALTKTAGGFAVLKGHPIVLEHQPKMDVVVLPRAEGTFHGRINELQTIGQVLTGDNRPRILTIHSIGGQGKTVLAREAVERFAYAWPGGVLAISLENLPDLDQFIRRLVNFVGINTNTIQEMIVKENSTASFDGIEDLIQEHIIQILLERLNQRRTLIVLDNAETLMEKVDEKDKEALKLAHFIRQKLTSPMISLLVTSRFHLGWTGEMLLELEGLKPDDGARLFWQSAPGHIEALHPFAIELSKKVDGHPLSLRLLGGAFDASGLSIEVFIREYEDILAEAEDKYIELDHRHRMLFTSIETSVRHLSDELKALLGGLWVFNAPFMAETATEIFSSKSHYSKESNRSLVESNLQKLWQRGLLEIEICVFGENSISLYRLPSIIRMYIENNYSHLNSLHDKKSLLDRFARSYSRFADSMVSDIRNKKGVAYVIQRVRNDLERVLSLVTGEAKNAYMRNLVTLMEHLGYIKRAIQLAEMILEHVEEHDQGLTLAALVEIGYLHRKAGNLSNAFQFYEKALLLSRDLGNRKAEAKILNNMSVANRLTGKSLLALQLSEKALDIRREVGDQEGEAITLNSTAEIYRDIGNVVKAIELHEQALFLIRRVGDHVNEANILNNLALDYKLLHQNKKALDLFTQALEMARNLGDRFNEGSILGNIADIYAEEGNNICLEIYNQILLIHRETENLVGEAIALTNMGVTYIRLGNFEEARNVLDQALIIHREVPNRTGEADALAGLSIISTQNGNPENASGMLREAIKIYQEVGNVAVEAALLFSLAKLLYEDLGQKDEPIRLVTKSISILQQHNLLFDVGGSSVSEHQDFLIQMQGVYSIKLDANDIRNIIIGTISVMTDKKEQYSQWRDQIKAIKDRISTEGHKKQYEIEFLKAVLDILDNQEPSIALDNPYYDNTKTIKNNIDRGGLKGKLFLEEEIQNLIGTTENALRKGGDILNDLKSTISKMMYMEKQIENAQYEVEFLNAILVIINGQEPSIKTYNPYHKYIYELQEHIDAESRRIRLIPRKELQGIILKTVAVINNKSGDHNKWRNTLIDNLEITKANNYIPEAEFFEEVINILDGKEVSISEDNLYFKECKAIQDGIAKGGIKLKHMSEEELEQIRKTVITAKIGDVDAVNNSRSVIIEAKFRANTNNDQAATEFFEALLSVLNNNIISLSGDNPYLDEFNALSYCMLGDDPRVKLDLVEEKIGLSGETTPLISVGKIFQKYGKPNEALRCFERALMLHGEDDHQSEAKILKSMGEVYDRIGKVQIALDYYLRALPIMMEFSDQSDKASIFNDVGEAYRRIGNYKEGAWGAGDPIGRPQRCI